MERPTRRIPERRPNRDLRWVVLTIATVVVACTIVVATRSTSGFTDLAAVLSALAAVGNASRSGGRR